MTKKKIISFFQGVAIGVCATGAVFCAAQDSIIFPFFARKESALRRLSYRETKEIRLCLSVSDCVGENLAALHDEYPSFLEYMKQIGAQAPTLSYLKTLYYNDIWNACAQQVENEAGIKRAPSLTP